MQEAERRAMLSVVLSEIDLFILRGRNRIVALQSASKDGILTIRIEDDRLVDPSVLTRMFEELDTLLHKSTEDRVIIDFRNVQFMASSALGKLVQFQKKSKEYSAKVKFAGITKEIYEVFKITKLHKMFDIEKDEAAARKAFQKTGIFK